MKVIGFAGYSGSGKTTLIEKLLPMFVAKGWTVSVIKYSHHGFDIDRPGKDSYRHRVAGAQEVMLSSNARWALMHELRDAQAPTLAEQLEKLSPCDLVIVEGHKSDPDLPKIEVHRPSLGKPLIHPEHAGVIALASDAPVQTDLPVLDLNKPQTVFEFVLNYLERT